MFEMTGANILNYKGIKPQFGHRVFVASGCCLAGEITAGDDVSFWFNVSARGDVNYIKIGDRTNIQDNAVIHVTHGGNPTIIGKDVTVGHGAIIHAATIKDLCLIGMGSILLDGAVIPKYSLIAAGSVVSPGSTFPDGSLILGSPAKTVRKLTEKEIKYIHWSAEHYINLARNYEDS